MISAIGANTSECLEALKDRRSGIGPITQLKSIHQGVLPIAEVKQPTSVLLSKIGASGSLRYTRTALLGIIAAREAVTNSGITDIGEVSTGLVSASTVGGMDRSEQFYSSFISDNRRGKLMDVVNHDCADATERIAADLGISGLVTTISTACSSSVNAIMHGSNLIKAGLLERVVVGGTDSLTKFTLNGFNTLMILDKKGCRPFDENRAGLTLGEGAAFLVLESEEAVNRFGKTPLAEISGYGNANDAYHQTASSPDGKGAFLAMTKALALSGMKPGAIDYINVHGTGTQNNDLSEGIAMERVFEERVPPFSSTKAYTGHTLGAAGAMEAVISVLSLQNHSVFPNLNFSTPMKELHIQPVTEMISGMTLRHVLSNSFGFGGNNSSIIISSVR